jgi:hypothetical protein
MASTPRAEYVGFTVNETSRVYTLRVRRPGHETLDFTLAIENQAFISKRVKYQDGPAICFDKLERELQANGDSMPVSHFQVSDDELEEYREAHTVKPSKSRPKWPG